MARSYGLRAGRGVTALLALVSCIACGLMSGLDRLQEVGCADGCGADAGIADAANESIVCSGTDAPSGMDAASEGNGDQVPDASIDVGLDATTDGHPEPDATSEAATDAATDGRPEADATSEAATDAAQPDVGSERAPDASVDSPGGIDAAPCSSTLLAPIPPAIASTFRGTNISSLAIDGNLSTRWESLQSTDVDGASVDPQWIYVDFGTRVLVNRVRVLWQDSCAETYSLQISDDATNWTTMPRGDVINLVGAQTPPADWSTATDTIGLSGAGRYLRVFGTMRCRSQYGYSMWEMQVFGHTLSTCDAAM